jgi:hypothetical protein
MRPAWLENWLIRYTPPCREVVRQLSDGMDRPLPFSRRIAVRLHFQICDWCLRYQRQLQLIRTFLRSNEPDSPLGDSTAGTDARLPDETRERLKRLLRHNPS